MPTAQAPTEEAASGTAAANGAPTFIGCNLLLSTRSHEILRSEGTLQLSGRSGAFFGAAGALLHAWVESERIIEGTLTIDDVPVTRALASTQAGYAPPRLPAPETYRVGDALLLGARLSGLDMSDVARALESCMASGLTRKRLSELSPLQHRLIGLAHALVGDPNLIILEDPYEDLDDAESEIMESLLEKELAERFWLAAIVPHSAWSRRLAEGAHFSVVAEGGRLIGPVRPADLSSAGFWAGFSHAPESLLTALEARGARVLRASASDVLLVRGCSGAAILGCAREAGVSVDQLTPLNPMPPSDR